SGIPVAVVPFAFHGLTQPAQNASDVLEADLARRGLFKMLPRKDLPSTPGTDGEVKFSEWRSLKLEGLVIGSVTLTSAGKYQVEFRLYDVFKQNQLAGYRYLVPPE